MPPRKKSLQKQPPLRSYEEQVTVEQDKNGLFIAKDVNGNIIWKEFLSEEEQKKVLGKTRFLGNKDTTAKYRVIQNESGEKLLIPISTKLEDAVEVLDKKLKHSFSEVHAAKICLYVSSGLTITQICREPGMPPPHAIYMWMAENEEFRKQMNMARKCRAEYFHDLIVDEAEEVTENTAKKSGVKIGAYKHLSSVNDPEVHGNRTKIVGDADQPLSFVIDTGIRRDQTLIEDKNEPEEN